MILGHVPGIVRALICRAAGHRWRRARNGEDAGMRYCARCGLARAVKARKAKSDG